MLRSKKGEWAYTPNLYHAWGTWPATESKELQINKIVSVQQNIRGG